MVSVPGTVIHQMEPWRTRLWPKLSPAKFRNRKGASETISLDEVERIML